MQMYLRSQGPRRVRPQRLHAVLSLGPHRVQLRHRKAVARTTAARSVDDPLIRSTRVHLTEHFLRPGVSLQGRDAEPNRQSRPEACCLGGRGGSRPQGAAPNIQKSRHPRGPSLLARRGRQRVVRGPPRGPWGEGSDSGGPSASPRSKLPAGSELRAPPGHPPTPRPRPSAHPQEVLLQMRLVGLAQVEGAKPSLPPSPVPTTPQPNRTALATGREWTGGTWAPPPGGTAERRM